MYDEPDRRTPEQVRQDIIREHQRGLDEVAADQRAREAEGALRRAEHDAAVARNRQHPDAWAWPDYDAGG